MLMDSIFLAQERYANDLNQGLRHNWTKKQPEVYHFKGWPLVAKAAYDFAHNIG